MPLPTRRPLSARRIAARVVHTLRMVASGQWEPPLGETRFVIFAHVRSGSTSLVRALERHPRIRILTEPFNERFTTWHPGDRDYRDLVRDASSMDQELAYMFADVNGIKVLSNQMPPDLYAHMLRNPDLRVIYLRRANLLQAVVSTLIAEQTDVWHAWDLEQPVEDVYSKLQPLDADDIRQRITGLREEIAFFSDVVSSRPEEEVLELVYEDVYLGTAEDRRRSLARTFAFVGLEPISDEEMEAVMDPERTKLNQERLYEFLPNAKEIDAIVGSDETGWLLESAHGDGPGDASPVR